MRALAERLDAPVFMTINGKGILPPGHPLRLSGNLGMAPLRAELAAADVVLAIGTEFGETEMYPEPHPVAIAGKLIHVDIDPLQLVTQFPADAADRRRCEAGGCRAFSPLCPPAGRRQRGAARAKAIREEVDDGLWPACATHRRIMEIVDEALPDAIVAGDQTEPVYCANQFYRRRGRAPSSTPAPATARWATACRRRSARSSARRIGRSCALIGDGGIQFSLQEMAAAVEAGIAVAVIVWNNASYGEIKAFMADRDIPQIGVDIFTPDFRASPAPSAARQRWPRGPEHLLQLLKDARSHRRPGLIEIDETSGWLSA